MAKKIPATVITGFLGAGKTSLIRHMIENANGKKLAFLINEFGDLGIDREMLLGCGIEGCTEDDIVELANGCICCTVADDFLPAMEKILDRDDKPDHILIETSGLALPKPLVKAFNWPEIRAQVTVDGVITVVDTKAVSEGRFANDEDAIQAIREADNELDHDNPLEEVFEDQLQCADMVILNKADLLSDDEIYIIEKKLRSSLRDGVNFIHSANAKVDIAILLGIDAAAEDDLDARYSHHENADGEHIHDHDEFISTTIKLGQIIDADKLQAGLIKIVKQHDILRIKGFLYRPNVERREVIQAVGPRFNRYFDRKWLDGEVKQSNIVVITTHSSDMTAIIEAIESIS